MSEEVAYTTSVRTEGLLERTLAAAGERLDQAAQAVSGDWLSTVEREYLLREAYTQELSRGLDETAPLDRVGAMLMALEKAPVLESCVAATEKADWELLRRKANDLALSRADSSREQAQALENRLRGMVAQGHKYLAELEHRAATFVLVETFAEQGYAVEQRPYALRATRGGMTVWVKSSVKGELSLDMSGYSGLRCVQDLKLIEAALEVKGLRLQRQHGRTHCRPEGGQLAQDSIALFDCFPCSRAATPAQGKKKICQPIMMQTGRTR